MLQLWQVLLYQPLVNALIFLYKFLGNFGWAVVVLTVLLRVLLIPLTVPSLKAASKLKELAPEIEKLKRKYKDDKQKFAQAQLELYRRAGANPVAGCLPQIIQLVVLIALYQAFIQVLQANGAEVISRLNQSLYPGLHLSLETEINTRFFYLDLSRPDVFRLADIPFPLPGAFLLAAALVQVVSSKMMQPAVAAAAKKAKKTPGKEDDLVSSMQSQMLYLFPLMTIVIGYSFPSGLVLYWLVFSISMVVQQYFISGWGGMIPWLEKLKLKK